MAQGDTTITLVGNLVDAPELRFTPSGAAVAKFRIASTPRIFDKNTNDWRDGDALFMTVDCWRQLAENVAESLERGTRVVVVGRLKQESYETKEGEKRTVYKVEADEVAPSLKFATAKPNKTSRNSGGASGGFGGNSGGFGGNGGGGSNGGGGGDDVWASAGAPSGGGFSDEPPF
jgi:single-strand DNA-binding protein